MIKVTYTQDTDKRECSLRLEGHAGQAKVGEDIVCASASILAYTLAQNIKSMEEYDQLEESPTIEMESGDATVVCRAKDAFGYAEMLHTFLVIKIGYKLLAHNYPQFVEFINDVTAE